MNRRHFFRTTALAGLAATQSRSFAALAADNAYRQNIGLQLYTLRNELAKDTPGTIKAVVEAGYKQGEMAGFPDTDAVVKAAKEFGLELHSSHFQWDTVLHPKSPDMPDFLRILDKAKAAGLTHLVIPYLQENERQTLDDFKHLAEQANKAAVKAKEAGIQLAYHNHSFEFAPKEGGRTGYEILVAEFSPDMKFEMDVFWIKAGGHDPVKMLQKLSGRVSQVHLKDLKDGIPLPAYGSVPPDAFQELGDGIIPMEPIILAAKEAGVAHCHVEQDQSPDPLASIRQSIGYLKKM